MKDKEIFEVLGIPARTLAGWKKADQANWRKKLYLYISLKTKEELQQELKRVENLLSLPNQTNS